jgi:hypothetical protein
MTGIRLGPSIGDIHLSEPKIVEIKPSLNLEQCKDLLREYENPVGNRGIRFEDYMQWPDQYVVTWKDELRFKIANWVYPVTVYSDGYREDEYWEVEISKNPGQPVFRLEKHPSNLKNKILVFFVLFVVSAVLIIGKLVPTAYVGLGWGALFIVFFFRIFIFDDETFYCVRFLEKLLKP